MIYLSKKKLEKLYNDFNDQPLHDDPLIFPHRFRSFQDKEFTAFLSSIFAYGNIKQILKILERIFYFFGKKPVKKLLLSSKADIINYFDFGYRFYTKDDILSLIFSLKEIYSKHSSIKMFLPNILESSAKEIISNISVHFNELCLTQNNIKKHSLGIQFMFPHPEKGSTCKRMNLFLRWMVRKDNLDLGLWQEVGSEKLIIPIDTHICKICKGVGLTQIKNPSWKMAEEITENLKRFDPKDPVKFDFALCHLGIRKQKL